MHAPLRSSSILLVLSAIAAVPSPAAPRFDGAYFGQSGNSSWSVVPISFAIADIDGDGHPDVVTPGPGQTLQVLLGTGDGSLGSPVSVVPGTGRARHVAVADFDLDGHLDIGTTTFGSGSEAAVYFGTGSSSVWQRVPIPITEGFELCAADVDVDGRPDLVSVLADGVLRSFLSRPGRTFQVVSETHSNFYGHFQSMVPRDLDADGRVDLVLAARWSPWQVWIGRGRGDGTFQLSGLVEPGDPGAVDVADVIGGPALDLIVPHRWGLEIQEGLGDGTFGARQSLAAWGTERGLAALARDVTGDGIPDIVSSDGTRDAIYVRPGLDGGGFGPRREVPAGRNLHPMQLADMNGDGALDVVATSTDHDGDNSVVPGILVALGDGMGAFGSRPTRLPIPSASSVRTIAGDFDEDGRPDLAAIVWPPGPTLRVFHVGPGRTLVAGQSFAIGTGVSSGFAVDLDGNDHLDLVLDAHWLAGAGDGTFASPLSLPTGGGPVLAVADLTGDGLLDLVTASGSSLRIHPATGGGSFGGPISRAIFQTNSSFVRIGDLNGDAHLDVLARDGSRMVLTYGPFPGPAAAPDLRWDSWNQPPFTIGDVDGDGRDDVVESRILSLGHFAGAELHVRLQKIDGSLGAPIVSLWSGAADQAMKLVDLDGDGVRDLIHRGADVYLGLGTGDGRFALEGSTEAGDWWDPPFDDAAALDFDGDGCLDLVGIDTVQDTIGLQIHWGRDAVPPSVANVAVTPGGALTIGEWSTVYWTASDDVGLGESDVFLSRSGPAGPFVKLGSASAGSFTFPWVVTGPPTDSLCFKVLARDLDGNTMWSRTGLVSSVTASTSVASGAGLPARLSVSVRGANPARERVRIALAVPRAGRARLTLVDLQGRRVATLLDEPLPAGTIEIDRRLPDKAGLLFLRFEGAGETAAARIAVIR